MLFRSFKRDFEDWEKNLDRDVKLVFDDARKETEKPGALGAIANTIKDESIDEDVLVLGGDNYFQYSFKDFIKQYDGTPFICAYDIGSAQDASKFGVLNAKRSEEHTSELQSHSFISYAVFCLKKKKK